MKVYDEVAGGDITTDHNNTLLAMSVLRKSVQIVGCRYLVNIVIYVSELLRVFKFGRILFGKFADTWDLRNIRDSIVARCYDDRIETLRPPVVDLLASILSP